MYEYDFGDNWVHDMVIEEILPASQKVEPICFEGERACPPEDCGGFWGYQNFLKAILNLYSAEHKQMVEWVGKDFHPEHFGLEKVNAELKKLRV